MRPLNGSFREQAYILKARKDGGDCFWGQKIGRKSALSYKSIGVFNNKLSKKKLGHTRSVIGEPLKFPGRDVDVFPLTNFLKGLKVTQVAVKGPFLL